VRKPADGFLSRLAAPARRALENAGITNIEQLSHYSIQEILNLHGLGNSSIQVLTEALANIGKTFSQDKAH
jgi:DNA-directed RNA polymerase alpha subunit